MLSTMVLDDLTVCCTVYSYNSILYLHGISVVFLKQNGLPVKCDRETKPSVNDSVNSFDCVCIEY